MAALEKFLQTGHAADLILLLVFLEGLALFLRHRAAARDQRVPVSRWLSPLLAGAALVIALRLALTDGAPGPIALALLVAGLAHLGGARQRWGV